MPVERLFYRIVRTDPPTIADFLSNRARGKARRPVESVREWEGLSLFDTEAQARRMARRFPRLGVYIAALRVPADGPIVVEQTFGPGHYTLWGDPQDFLPRVVAVVPVAQQQED